MDIDRLRQSYLNINELCAICNVLGNRTNNQKITKIQSLLNLLNRDREQLIKQSKLVAAFRELEHCGCGEYIEGRHGHVSRFVWNREFGSLNICRNAMGLSDEMRRSTYSDENLQVTDDVGEFLDAEEENDNTDQLIHFFNLRADFQLEISLPVDLTTSEADRLAAFIISLPMDNISEEDGEESFDPKEDSPEQNQNHYNRETKGRSIFGKALRILNRKGGNS